jgi:hypothetical protein
VRWIEPEGAAELGGLPFACELFLEGPMVVVADEDTIAIAVEGQGNAEAGEAGAHDGRIHSKV